jgi:hypothetical protein
MNRTAQGGSVHILLLSISALQRELNVLAPCLRTRLGSSGAKIKAPLHGIPLRWTIEMAILHSWWGLMYSVRAFTSCN